jgi:hypothetical protein
VDECPRKPIHRRRLYIDNFYIKTYLPRWGGLGGASSALASAPPFFIYLRPVSLNCEVDLWVEVLVYECPYTTKEVLIIIR